MNPFVLHIGKTIQNLFKIFRIDAFPLRPGYHYVPDFYGRSAFKHTDIRELQIFGDLAKKIIDEGKTNHYYDRLYTIYQAISNIIKLPYDQVLNFVEIGVYKGGTSKFIAAVAQSMSLPFRLYAVDTFEGHANEDIAEVDGNHSAGLFGDTSYAAVAEYLNSFSEITVLKGRFQDVSNELVDKKFCFVHLDVDIYEPTKFALGYFAERMPQGGIIIVDDYGFSSCPGIEKALSEFLEERRDFTYFHVLGGQMILIKN